MWEPLFARCTLSSFDVIKGVVEPLVELGSGAVSEAALEPGEADHDLDAVNYNPFNWEIVDDLAG